MSYEVLVTWMVLSMVAIALPGPDFVYITSVSLRKRSYGIWGGIGVQLGITVHLILTYVGAMVFFTRHPLAFRGIQFLGALFLVYLSVKIILEAVRELKHLRTLKNHGEDADTSIYKLNKKEQISNFDCFKKGLFVNLLNPKAFVFIVSTLPQFLSTKASFTFTQQFMVLGSFHILFGVVWWVVLAAMVNFLSRRFATPSFRAKLELISGLIILFLAIALIIRIFVVLYSGDFTSIV